MQTDHESLLEKEGDDSMSVSSPEMSPLSFSSSSSTRSLSSTSYTCSEVLQHCSDTIQNMNARVKIKTFKLVGDNIDKNIKPHDMKFDQCSKQIICITSILMQYEIG